MQVMRYFLEKIDIMTETFVDTDKDITHGHYYQQFLEPYMPFHHTGLNISTGHRVYQH